MSLKVLGLGDNVADHYAHADTIYPGGCAYNFAMFARMQGAQAAYLGIVGDDVAGSHILRTAQTEGIDTSHCRVYHGEAPRPSAELVDGDRTFIGCNTGGVWERPVLLTEHDFAYAAGSTWSTPACSASWRNTSPPWPRPVCRCRWTSPTSSARSTSRRTARASRSRSCPAGICRRPRPRPRYARSTTSELPT